MQALAYLSNNLIRNKQRKQAGTCLSFQHFIKEQTNKKPAGTLLGLFLSNLFRISKHLDYF